MISSSDSSSSSEESDAKEIINNPRQHTVDVSDEEEKDNFGVPKTKNEVLPQELPPEELKVTLTENNRLVRVGIISHVVEDLLVVQSDKNPLSLLDMDSVLCLSDKTIIGKVEEVFGPVANPLYTTRLSKSRIVQPTEGESGETFLSKLQKDIPVFYVSEMSNYVDLTQIASKGSDASGEHDEEPPPDEVEFSDDEEEAKAKAAKKKGNKKKALQSGQNQYQIPSHAKEPSNPGFEYEPLQRPDNFPIQPQVQVPSSSFNPIKISKFQQNFRGKFHPYPPGPQHQRVPFPPSIVNPSMNPMNHPGNYPMNQYENQQFFPQTFQHFQQYPHTQYSSFPGSNQQFVTPSPITTTPHAIPPVDLFAPPPLIQANNSQQQSHVWGPGLRDNPNL